jgi:hypothetical protein
VDKKTGFVSGKKVQTKFKLVLWQKKQVQIAFKLVS